MFTTTEADIFNLMVIGAVFSYNFALIDWVFE